MAKKRIILAETEETVISALENKFIFDLRDEIDLEVITETDYFNEFFSKPQKADILVCGETMYSQDIKRHDIGKVFLLCENAGSGSTIELDVERVNKYSNPNVVESQVLRDVGGPAERQPIMVVICSANGGAGKTTLALGICENFANDYKRVLYINAERINTFHTNFNSKATLPNAIIGELANARNDVFSKIKNAIKKENFDYLPPFSVALSSIGIDMSIYLRIALSARESKEYDVIVVDTDSVFDEYKASLITKADRVLMVVNQTKASVFAMNTLLSNMNCNDKTKYFFVCNNFDANKENALKSSEVNPRFVVSESIAHIDLQDELKKENLAKRGDVQKTAYLLI